MKIYRWNKGSSSVSFLHDACIIFVVRKNIIDYYNISASFNFATHSVQIESDSAAASNHKISFELLDSTSTKSGGLDITLGASPAYTIACSTAKPLTLTGSSWKYVLEKRSNSIAFYVNGALIENMILSDSNSCHTSTWGRTTSKFKLGTDDNASDKTTFVLNGRFLLRYTSYLVCPYLL